MTSHAADIQRIKASSSLEDIQKIVRQYSGEAPPGSHGGILYSGRVGQIKSETIALEAADATGQPIINSTPRAQFLVAAEREIKESAARVYEKAGESQVLAKRSAINFLYGDAKAPIHSQTSLDGCLWGETSREFSGSLHGDVTLIASEAQIGRVFAVAEIPSALENGNISSLGGQPTEALRRLARHGDASDILKLTQDKFVKAATHGIFVSPNNMGPEISQVVISKEVAASLGLDTTPFSSAADLTAAGLKRVSTIAVAPPGAVAGGSVTASGRPGNTATPTSHGNLTASTATDDLSLALHAERMVATKVMVGGAAIVLEGYDTYTTAEKYQSLSAQGNQFGADALLRRYEGRTAGGFIGSMAAGAAYGFVAGSETGPGAFLTGAVGGVVGAFAGEKIATMVNEHKVNHQTGTDGVGYAYENGQWMLIQHEFSPNNPAMPASYALPSMKAVGTPAPAEQLAHLEYQRMTAETAVALGNPATQDTKNIDLGGTQWHATREGWAQRVEMPIVPRSHEFPTSIKVDKPAEARTSEELNQIAANRRFNNDHYSTDVSNAYVMDYYGKGWSANGPLPDVVTKPLGLSSEQHIKDPVTGNLWDATTDGHFSRENNHSVGRVFVRETVRASGEELSRLGQLQQSAVQSNEVYGKQLIAQKFEESRLAQLPDTVSHADGKRAASGPTASGPTMHDQASSSAPTQAEDPAIPKLIAPITPQSSNREMFDALMTATQNLDVDAMRSVSQNYLQSAQGQAWLEQGQQLNQQQAMAQQQAAQQQAQASHGPVR